MIRFINHEVRTPLSTVFMGLKHLKTNLNNDTSNASDDIKDTIVDCICSCDDALDVLNQLLLYDKLESSILQINSTDVPIVEFIQETTLPFENQV
jgi:signal transduction histidine kinase